MHPTDIRGSGIYTGSGPQGTLRPVDEPPGKRTFLGVALVNVLYILWVIGTWVPQWESYMWVHVVSVY